MTLPKIYNYHPQSFEYLGQSLADCSPMEEGVFLLPAFSTLLPPPCLKAKENAVFIEEQNKWQVIEDYRGETWFKADGASVDIKTLGNPAHLGLMQDAPQKDDKLNANKIDSKLESKIKTEAEKIHPVLSARQIRLLLRHLDKLSLLQGFINALPHPKKEDAQIEWDYGVNFDHEHFLVQLIMRGLAIDPDRFNQAWLLFSNR